MADHIVVMRAGVVEQQGSPLDLYDRPANRFVAGFIGSPAMNFIPVTVGPDGNRLMLEKDQAQSLMLGRALAPGRRLLAGLRPEHLAFTREAGDLAIKVVVEAVESTGSMTFVTASIASQQVVAAHSGRPEVSRGRETELFIAPGNVHLFDPETELAVF